MYESLTLTEIQAMTGHETTDAVRMALHRAEKKPNGVDIALPRMRRTFAGGDVWEVFGERILKNAQADEKVKATVLSVFGSEIRTLAQQQDLAPLAAQVFSTSP